MIGFGEEDRRANENAGVARIALTKSGENLGNISLIIRALTLQEYAEQVGPLPPVFTNLPDPAECESHACDLHAHASHACYLHARTTCSYSNNILYAMYNQLQCLVFQNRYYWRPTRLCETSGLQDHLPSQQ